MEAPEKKAWSALHGAWGKRPVKQAQYNGGESLIQSVPLYIVPVECVVLRHRATDKTFGTKTFSTL